MLTCSVRVTKFYGDISVGQQFYLNQDKPGSAQDDVMCIKLHDRVRILCNDEIQ